MRNTLLFLFLIAAISVSAQTQVLKGRIVDSKTQEGLTYTNIGVEGTFYGTASDAEGFFELNIPDQFKAEKLYISAVGYKNKSIDLNGLLSKDFNLIKLDAQTYGIADVDVAAQSRVLFRIIKSASQNISKNFTSNPVGYKVFYSERITTGFKTQVREAVAKLYDENGYKNCSVKDAFDSRNFQFVQSKKSFDTYSFPEGSNGFEELLEMDIVRSASTILNEKLLNDFDLQLVGQSVFEGDSVWIIAYKTAETDLAHTGDFYAEKMNGKIYVSKSDYGIIRNECAIEASKNNRQNRSLATKANSQQKVKYNFTSTYKKENGKYHLAFLSSQKSFVNGENIGVKSIRNASVLEVDNSPSKIIGKDYFEDVVYEESFWQSFKKPF